MTGGEGGGPRIYITAIRMSDDGWGIERITHVAVSRTGLFYSADDEELAMSDAVQMVAREDLGAAGIGSLSGGVWVKTSREESRVFVVNGPRARYLRSSPDETPEDNLLSLPEF